MMNHTLLSIVLAASALAAIKTACRPMIFSPTATSPTAPADLSPVAIAAFDGAQKLLVLCSTGRRAVIVDRRAARCIGSFDLPVEGNGLCVRGNMAYITTNEPAGRVLVVDLSAGGVVRNTLRAGHTPMSPVLSPDASTLYVANRFDSTVSILHLADSTSRTIPVIREPVAMALTPDGRLLFVANHLPCVRPFLDDENPFIGAEVSVIDAHEARLIANIELPNGSQGLRGIAISPDGRHAAVTHILSNYTVPTARIEGGAINKNAVSLLDVRSLEWIETVMLDDPHCGAANPWAVAFADARTLLVTHAGTHELSVVDFPALLERVRRRGGATGLYDEKDLGMMANIRKRIALPVNGPRALLALDGAAYIAGFFSDNLAAVDLRASEPRAHEIALLDGASPAALPTSTARMGERYFNDATLCFEHWQSCASCHPDGRTDALYWDLLNDGIGNTKNTKSLLGAPYTPPMMWRGVREDAAIAARAGIEHIQFAEPPDAVVGAIEAYLRSMKAVPSPRLNAQPFEPPKPYEPGCLLCHYPGVPRGTLSEAARRGKALFEGKAGCVECHPHPWFTNQKQADPGLGAGTAYDVPSLIEVWRTAPYLHSGDATTLREAVVDFNVLEKRGRTKNLSDDEIADLLEYLESL
ncbi:MAG: c-type cytochrome [Candidatus Sumerlaeia bacterium]|nr:c-type cytochrome [Candidatus Sumerlaeia bacterium]